MTIQPPAETARPRTACGGVITDDPARYPTADYQGQTLYFCLRACRRVFAQDPAGFLAGTVPHPTEEDAAG